MEWTDRGAHGGQGAALLGVGRAVRAAGEDARGVGLAPVNINLKLMYQVDHQPPVLTDEFKITQIVHKIRSLYA